MTNDRRLSLIDVSSADDSLIANPFPHSQFENESLLSTPNSRKFDDAAVKLREWEREPQSNEIENSNNRNSKCNLRKSLAWDKAFFTSPGVLDPEELSSMIEGVGKDRKHALRLPGIQENMHKSCESTSSMVESDSLNLESLEAGLFEDVRASIQKFSTSFNASPESANTRVSSRFQTPGSSKKVGMASSNKASSSKSPNASTQGNGMLTKKNPITPRIPRPAARREESISKQPKTIGKSNSSSVIPSKRASHGDLHVKSEKDKAKRIIGQFNPMTNTSIKNSRVNVPKPTISSKSPSHLSAVPKTRSTTSTSSSSNLSGNIDKSPLNSLKRKVDAGTKKPPSPCSIVRTPARTASRDKIVSSNSSLSSFLSVTNLSSSISPASSISDRSSGSSSTSASKYRSNSSRTSFGSRSSRKDLYNNRNTQSDSSLRGKQTQLTGFISPGAKTRAPGMVPPASEKPSSLRLPSPKIGFFDAVKSSDRTPHREMQTHSVVAHGLPKPGAGRFSPGESPNKAKLRKLQPSRSTKSIENKKFNNQQASHPIPLHESSGVAVKTSMALQRDKGSSTAPIEVQSKMHLKGGVSNLDAKNTSVEGSPSCKYDQNPVSTQDGSHFDDQVDYLSKQVGSMDINSDGRR